MLSCRHMIWNSVVLRHYLCKCCAWMHLVLLSKRFFENLLWRGSSIRIAPLILTCSRSYHSNVSVDIFIILNMFLSPDWFFIFLQFFFSKDIDVTWRSRSLVERRDEFRRLSTSYYRRLGCWWLKFRLLETLFLLLFCRCSIHIRNRAALSIALGHE